jgi:hypothetical protein
MDSKMQALLGSALAKTEGGGLEWQAFSSDAFHARIGPGFLHIQRGSTELSSDGENFSPYVTYSIQVSDSQGRVVAEAEVVKYQDQDAFRLCDRLFEAARKSALKSDHVIDDMLKTLQGAKP